MWVFAMLVDLIVDRGLEQEVVKGSKVCMVQIVKTKWLGQASALADLTMLQKAVFLLLFSLC